VRGRCLSYGEGITYWPVVEVVKQLPTRELGERRRRAVERLLGEERAVTLARRSRGPSGKLLERPRRAPLVVVFDDVHWGEPTLPRPVEHVADSQRGAPILLLCMAGRSCSTRAPAGAAASSTRPRLLEPLGRGQTES
jgi:hypothetical protein